MVTRRPTKKEDMSYSVTAPLAIHPITIETGKLAKLADGAVTVRCGDTIILVTAVSATSIKEGQDWFPLSVDYREKAAAAGKFPGGYFKREGRPTEKEILTCRMTDRPLRPLFPKGYLYDTQIIAILLSADGENDPDILTINGATAALMRLRHPVRRPDRRRARRPRQWPVRRQPDPHPARRAATSTSSTSATKTDVIMIEGAANELPEDEFIKALAFAQDASRASSSPPRRNSPPNAGKAEARSRRSSP